MSNLGFAQTVLQEGASAVYNGIGTAATLGNPAAPPLTGASATINASVVSRLFVSIIAKPSIETVVRPAAFYDLVSSFSHPSNWNCFLQGLPNLVGMAATAFSNNLSSAFEDGQIPGIMSQVIPPVMQGIPGGPSGSAFLNAQAGAFNA